MDLKSCVRCSMSHSGPQAFLMTCSECHRAWHHRCHIPPIEDAELVTRIQATNRNDVDNGLDGWVCKRCRKNLGAKPAFVTPPVKAAPKLAVGVGTSSASVRVGVSGAETQVIPSMTGGQKESDGVELGCPSSALNVRVLDSNISKRQEDVGDKQAEDWNSSDVPAPDSRNAKKREVMGVARQEVLNTPVAHPEILGRDVGQVVVSNASDPASLDIFGVNKELPLGLRESSPSFADHTSAPINAVGSSIPHHGIIQIKHAATNDTPDRLIAEELTMDVDDLVSHSPPHAAPPIDSQLERHIPNRETSAQDATCEEDVEMEDDYGDLYLDEPPEPEVPITKSRGKSQHPLLALLKQRTESSEGDLWMRDRDRQRRPWKMVNPTRLNNSAHLFNFSVQDWIKANTTTIKVETT